METILGWDLAQLAMYARARSQFDVLNSAETVSGKPHQSYDKLDVLTGIIEPGILIFVTATPLCLPYVQIGMDEQAFRMCKTDDIIPDLETSGLRCPIRVMFDYIIGGFGAILESKGHNHRHLQRNVFAVAVIDLINHLESVAPAKTNQVSKVKIALVDDSLPSGNDLHANKVEPDSCHTFQYLSRGGKLQPFRNHSLHWIQVNYLAYEYKNGGVYSLLKGQLTPAQVTTSPLSFTMSLPLVLKGAYGQASDIWPSDWSPCGRGRCQRGSLIRGSCCQAREPG